MGYPAFSIAYFVYSTSHVDVDGFRKEYNDIFSRKGQKGDKGTRINFARPMVPA